MLDLNNLSAPSLNRLTLPGGEMDAVQAIQPNVTGLVKNTDAVNGDFASVMKGALDQVNAMQMDADKQRTEFELGLSDDLIGTMITSQKASLSFQGVIQVRNRVVSAYETVYNMPV
ncbi:flagellar hook-basal body complex protein FliE [Endozoicomonas sp. OPT23]|uniref:flagellar hook-basal body complex protein FliE n=1 Tax=Endozoicomonas sp. OPT23 TaxID=2072845 RepID=UPI00129BD527|nr:flagellar hook-basal body complex protein FliE [Endozoicomonas sp. OPT23]MRI33943.1 flagellar hook-basal body complex protein FliE [Endozoicomonas sp. OPT23]